MSFSKGNYSVKENASILTISVKKYVGSDAHVLIATHPSEGTAKGEGILCTCTLFTVLCTCIISWFVFWPHYKCLVLDQLPPCPHVRNDAL